MNELILQSVIEITGHRDIDSLECSLVMTLAGLAPCRAISIYKLLDDADSSSIEESVRLDIHIGHNSVKEYIWSEIPRFISRDEYVEKCLMSGKTVKVESDAKSVSLIIPVVSGKNVVGAIGMSGPNEVSLSEQLIKNIVKIYENYLYILNESERDKLTNLFNRRTFDKKLERLLTMQVKNQKQKIHSSAANEKRKNLPGSTAWLVILDIDHFKRVNDEFGHVCGDEVILMLSQKMRECFRSSDLLFRFGGEEFVVILEPIPPEMASLALERFRKKVEEHEFPLVKTITVSIGYARISASDYPQTVLENADKALYYSKDHGRNCMHSYEFLLEMGHLETVNKIGSVDLF